MTADQWSSVEEHVAALSELPPGEVNAALAGIPDEAVRKEVASLLGHLREGETIGGIVGAMASQIGSKPAPDQRVGPYRLVQRRGEGGQGAVYEAVRDDGTFHQRVAIKLIKWELDSEAARRQFRHERQILAGLEHPQIARLLDGGETESGLSYIVMEFVDGENIVAHAERNRLSLVERLHLFLKVCAAVQYAHQNLIVHRDLKPGNILVTPEGTPKLLDFGIAKLIDPSDDRTVTRYQALTPNYASPEQVRGGAITTVSDVYSLGIVLYELLTGRLPYMMSTLTATEVERTVCETQPSAPGVSPDIDNIILMALRKEPSRRYQSVEQFAEDIERSLDNRPVLARADTFLYRTGKYIRRNSIWVAAGALTVLSLSTGLGVAAYQARVAANQARLAQERFQQVRKLANTFLFQFHDEIADIPGTTRARALVVKTALEYLDNLYRDAANDPQLKAEVAQAYQRVGDVQGLPRRANLSDPKGAAASYERALGLYESLMAGDPQYAKDAAECLRSLAFLRLNASRANDARAALKRAFALMEPFRSEHTESTLLLFSRLYESAGDAEELDGSLETERDNYRKAVEYKEEWAKLAPAGQTANVALQLAGAHLRLGRALMSLGELNQAAPEMEAALAHNERAIHIEPKNVRFVTNHTAVLLSLSVLYDSGAQPSLERHDASIRTNRAAIEEIRPMMEADVNDLHSKVQYTTAFNNLAHSLAQAHEGAGLPEALRALTLWKELHGTGLTMADKLATMFTLHLIVPILSRGNHHAEALELIQDLIREYRQFLTSYPPEADEHWLLAWHLGTAADELRAQGRVDEARRALAEGTTVIRPFEAAANQEMQSAFVAADFYRAMQRDRVAAGDCSGVEAWWRKEVALWPQLASRKEYAAMRLRRAQAAAPACR
ncbi:MAG TPA: serine/threonine-protein kinase [Bryobacteraceae bacterium]|nr:serine/threonine-protein kinase [Bryobacteraceae bacterium]